MSDYKLVPMEPTADMVIAGEDAWDTQLEKRLFAKDNGEAFATYPSEETHELCSRVAYRAMLAAAPAVQEEPVAWPLASKEDAGMGWTIDYCFLEQVEKAASLRTDFTTSMEAAEQVLIAAAELLAAYHKQGVEP